MGATTVGTSARKSPHAPYAFLRHSTIVYNGYTVLGCTTIPRGCHRAPNFAEKKATSDSMRRQFGLYHEHCKYAYLSHFCTE